MSANVSLKWSDDEVAQLEALSSKEGVPQSEILRLAFKEYVFVRRFRELRGEMMRDLEERGIRLTDEDVFETVS